MSEVDLTAKTPEFFNIVDRMSVLFLHKWTVMDPVQWYGSNEEIRVFVAACIVAYARSKEDRKR